MLLCNSQFTVSTCVQIKYCKKRKCHLLLVEKFLWHIPHQHELKYVGYESLDSKVYNTDKILMKAAIASITAKKKKGLKWKKYIYLPVSQRHVGFWVRLCRLSIKTDINMLSSVWCFTVIYETTLKLEVTLWKNLKEEIQCCIFH